MRLFVLPACLLFALAAHAAPQLDHVEQADTSPADRGLISHLHQVRQKVVDRTSDLVITAIGFLDVPYKFGGSTVESGFDCSGFVRAMYNQTVGHLLPRRAEEQAAATQKIARTDLKPGDLVFFNTMRRAFSHVGIYVGEGKFIHAPRTGATETALPIAAAHVLDPHFGARRVLSADDDKGAAGE